MSRLGQGLFFLLVYVPLAGLVVDGLGAVGSLNWPGWQLVSSAGLSALVALTALALGLVLASCTWQGFGHRLYRWRYGVLALAAVPAYLQGRAWDTAWGGLGQWLSPQGAAWSLMTPTGLWWTETMAVLPLATALALLALEAVDQPTVEAGRLQRDDLAVFSQVVRSQAGSTLAAGGALLFALALVESSLPALLGVRASALDVFVEFSASGNTGLAALQALPLVLVNAAAVAWSFRRLVGRTRPRPARATPPHWPGWWRGLQVLALIILALQAGLPPLCLGLAAGSWQGWFGSLTSSWSQICFSLEVSLGAALLTLPLALAWVQALPQRGPGTVAWMAFTAFPLAVPPALVGIGLSWLASQWPGFDLRTTAVLPVVACGARFASAAALVVAAYQASLNPALWDAALLLQRNAWQTWRYIRLPLLLPGLVAAGLLVLALSLGEHVATLPVMPPGRETLPLYLFNYLHYGATGAVAALSALLVTTCLAAGVVGAGIVHRG